MNAQMTLGYPSLDTLNKLVASLEIKEDKGGNKYAFMGIPVLESKLLPEDGISFTTEKQISYFNTRTGNGWTMELPNFDEMCRRELLDRLESENRFCPVMPKLPFCMTTAGG